MAQETDPQTRYEPRETYDETTGWVGWIIFAGTMMIIGGSLNALANFLFIPVYRVWALTIITIDVLVIWALTAHGGEMRTR